MRIALIIIGVILTGGGLAGAYWWRFGESRTEITGGGKTYAIVRDGRDFEVWLVFEDGDELQIGTYTSPQDAAARVKCEIENPNGDPLRPSVGISPGDTMPMKSTVASYNPNAATEQQQQQAAFMSLLNA